MPTIRKAITTTIRHPKTLCNEGAWSTGVRQVAIVDRSCVLVFAQTATPTAAVMASIPAQYASPAAVGPNTRKPMVFIRAKAKITPDRHIMANVA